MLRFDLPSILPSMKALQRIFPELIDPDARNSVNMSRRNRLFELGFLLEPGFLVRKHYGHLCDIRQFVSY